MTTIQASPKDGLVSSGSTTLSYIKRLGSPVAALASGLGGPVSVIRISGRDLSSLESFFGGFPEPGSFRFVKVKSPTGVDVKQAESPLLDEGLLLRFKAPYSFTGEDVLEFQGHGVPELIEVFLDALEAKGVARALPGEFSFRAVWNKKMSMEEASRLQMLFRSENLGANSASKLLSVRSSQDEKMQALLKDCRDALTSARGRIEAAIDFSEAEEEQSEDMAAAAKKVLQVKKEIQSLLNSYEIFTSQSEVPTIVLAGWPNAGKSTLMNILCGGKRSLVSSTAGTTRDYVEVQLKTPSGQRFKLVDTAGLRDFESSGSLDENQVLESEGIQVAKELIDAAALVIWVHDARSFNRDEIESYFSGVSGQLEKLRFLLSHGDMVEMAPSDQQTLNLLNEADLASDFVWKAVASVFEVQRNSEKANAQSDEETLVSSRQKDLLIACSQRLDEVMLALNGDLALEISGDLMRECDFLLKQCTGEELSEDYIGEVFSQFCLGK